MRIETVEMHTAGEPTRIVVAGYPKLTGATLLDKRREARAAHDAVRKRLMFEPRGHPDMYGAVLVEPDHPEADLAVLFLHNEGYSTMCGHAVIALGRFAVDRGLVSAQSPQTTVNIQCPCGLVRAHVAIEEGRADAVRFESVPAFAFARDRVVQTATWGPVPLDIGYGGAFYAVLAADTIGLDVRASSVRDLADAGAEITEAAAAQIPLEHPDADDLAYLYGTILTDGRDAAGEAPTANICIFAGRQVDRSPTGSGVSARVALMHARDQLRIGQPRAFESVLGTRFTGTALREARAGRFKAVTVEVSGMAHYTGTAVFTVEADDPVADGFRLD